jgi:hypothetical protein
VSEIIDAEEINNHSKLKGFAMAIWHNFWYEAGSCGLDRMRKRR